MIRRLKLKEIAVDRSEIDEEAVEQIAQSFRDTHRQFHAIMVRPEGNGFRVVAGRHRVLAAEQVGWDSLAAEVLPWLTEEDQLSAELIEIDENLGRRKISPAYEALLVVRRKAIYERLYPEARAGAVRAAGMNRKLGRGGAGDGETFADNQSKVTGKSTRTIRRAAQRGSELGGETLHRVRGTSLDRGDELDALADIPLVDREDVIRRAEAGEAVSAKVERKKFKRRDKEADLGRRMLEWPKRRYGVIYADPPWRFETRSEAGMDRSEANHYPTMSTEEILAMDVPSIAAPTSSLFLWMRPPMRKQAEAVVEAWGYEIVAEIVWFKDRMGQGYWLRYHHEILLWAVRGAKDVLCPAPGTQPDSVIEAPFMGHSAKPPVFAEIIERLYPTLPKIELFARRARPGWDRWGKEAPADDAVTTDPVHPSTDLAAVEREIEEKGIAGAAAAALERPMFRLVRPENDQDDLEIPAFLRRQ